MLEETKKKPKLGRPLKYGSYVTRVSISLNPLMEDMLKNEAYEKRISFSELVFNICEDYFKNKNK